VACEPGESCRDRRGRECPKGTTQLPYDRANRPFWMELCWREPSRARPSCALFCPGNSLAHSLFYPGNCLKIVMAAPAGPETSSLQSATSALPWRVHLARCDSSRKVRWRKTVGEGNPTGFLSWEALLARPLHAPFRVWTGSTGSWILPHIKLRAHIQPQHRFFPSLTHGSQLPSVVAVAARSLRYLLISLWLRPLIINISSNPCLPQSDPSNRLWSQTMPVCRFNNSNAPSVRSLNLHGTGYEYYAS